MKHQGPWVYRNGRLVPKATAAPRGLKSVRGVISDSLPDLIHPCTGKRMDSKSEFRRVTREKGGTEVGNEPLVDRRTTSGLDERTRKADIAAAMEQLGYRG